MQYQTIRYCPEGKIATIRLNRPHRMNAVIEEMYRELTDLLETLESDPGIRVVILTGSVLEKNGMEKQAFCAGADLKKHSTGQRTLEQKKEYITLAHETCRKLHEFPKPVIAAINGPAMGAGAEMALCCDFIFMARTAILGFPETGLGTCTGGGATFHLSRLLGPARAKELIYTGRIINGESARNMGLALNAFPLEELMARVLDFAGELSEKAPISMKLVKRLIHDSQETPLAAILHQETEAILSCMETSDWQEGVTAFKEKENRITKESDMSLDKIFNAESIAIIGASRDETKRGFQAICTLKKGGYEGVIYPVNPREDNILGLKCYHSINDIKPPVDLALITTPAHTIPYILNDCGKKGVAGAVVIAGGFGELGAEGKELENEIIATAAQFNIRIVGPNTSGIINMHSNMNLVGLSDVPRGNIALITQSGNIALHIITEARLRSQKGFSYYVGVGNEADLKFHEYLEFFRNDPKTEAILMYVEGMGDGRKFLQQVYKTSREKPIILLKSGRSSTGQKSAGSHTGALAGISEVAKTSFVRAGIINIENPDELFPAAETLSSLPPIRNNKVAILADGGGHATIAADLLSDWGVKIPPLSKKTRKMLREILPHNAATENPVDVAGGTDSNPAVFADCARILLEDKNIGGLLIVGLFGGYGIRFTEQLRFIEEDAAHQMGKMLKKLGKPIILQSLYNSIKPHPLELLRYYGIPVYDSLDIACKCMSVLSHYGNYLGTYESKTNFKFNWRAKLKKESQAIINWALYEKRGALYEHEAKEILRAHGAPVTEDHLAKTEADAVRLAAKIGGEVVLKIVSPDILHKSDAGGVKLKLKGEAQIKKAFSEIINNARAYKKDAEIKGCIVSGMKEEGVEIIIGTKIDKQFGPVIMFGIGGILVEVVKDVSFRVLPLSRSAAKSMIQEIKSAPILDGFRGTPLDKRAITDLLITISEIIESYPEILEMDLNPVIVHHKGLDIVDARILLKQEETVPAAKNKIEGTT